MDNRCMSQITDPGGFSERGELTASEQSEERPAGEEAFAPRAGGLLIIPDAAELWEPFTYQAEPGVWLVAQWELSAKLSAGGTWFPFWWAGPGRRRWEANSRGRPPETAARFASAAAAAEALALDEISVIAEIPCYRRASHLVTTECPCGVRCAASCGQHVAVAHYNLTRACEDKPECSVGVAAASQITTDRLACAPLRLVALDSQAAGRQPGTAAEASRGITGQRGWDAFGQLYRAALRAAPADHGPEM